MNYVGQYVKAYGQYAVDADDNNESDDDTSPLVPVDRTIKRLTR